ncbi:MAG: dihydropteroate synthase [Tatlockia sp.]|nr:dihydropteroate synthase [Tatlockia sp.]
MNTEQFKQWRESYKTTNLKKPLIMGVLNVTPDSFSDGGLYYQPEQALKQAHLMIAAGADLIDIGGESTKPGALTVSCEEESARVIPVFKQLTRESEICLSIDTRKAALMRDAVYAGASIINDISGFRSEDSLAMAAELNVPLCIMHMQRDPQTMQSNPSYERDVVDEINSFFEQRITACQAAGIKRTNIILDPGFGFGKTVEHNLRIVNQIAQFSKHKLPIMLGVSRKSTLGAVLNTPVDQRLAGGLAVAVFAALQGVAIIRTHDVAETNQALTMVQAINKMGQNKEAGA